MILIKYLAYFIMIFGGTMLLILGAFPLAIYFAGIMLLRWSETGHALHREDDEKIYERNHKP